MQKLLVVFFVLFLVGTSEMQNVASSTSVTLSNNQITAENMGDYSSKLRQYYTQLSSTFDQNGSLKTIVNFFALSGMKSDDVLVISDRVLLAGALTLSMATTLELIQFKAVINRIAGSKFNTEDQSVVKQNLVNLLRLVSSACFFEGFMLVLEHMAVNNSANDARDIVPAFMKLFGIALLSLKPMTALMKFQKTGVKREQNIKYTDFYGLGIFHVGNMLQSGFMFSSDLQNPSPQKYGGKFRAASTLIFTVATAFLFAANEQVQEELFPGTVSKGTGLETTRQKVFNVLGDALLVMACSMFFFNNYIK
eukprot:c11410_g1_i1.p1 GENE.c11410_g1_i1~~c11410_g1_i1.p1  ORF type:complete len:333 (-),score=66.18 c11410_g1_i1:99-1022(-)